MSTSAGTDITLVHTVFGYTPNTTAAGIAAALFIILGVLTLMKVLRGKHWWGLCLPIGSFGSGLGYVVRIIMTKSHQDSKGFLTVQQILIACMPAFILAFNYVAYGRLLIHAVGSRHSLIRPSIISLVFVLSDVITFLVQAAGASFLVQTDQDKRNLGHTIFQVGIILQSVSYYVFVGLIGWTHWHIKREAKATGKEAWWKTVWALYISSLAIIIRTIFRLITASSPSGNTLSTHEVYLYVLDTLPLLISIVVYVPWWPGSHIFQDSIISQDMYKLTEQTSA